ncbi:hypothetical protein [uncultured Aquimarina sp.]|uniref:hypothetical protein n=1 Tax=uncultured Aquimarina sp. TaxID=575652 RepID=UPI00261341EC|nr:hypothetical protein [uncultured Aquimarina sp.]
MKSVNGFITRVYAHVGGGDGTLKVYGEPEGPESDLTLVNSLCEDAQYDDYWERDDIDNPDEELLMEIAENWSVDPTKLTERKDIKKELGLTGK